MGKFIHDFAFALLVGILVGTYSSIYVASPAFLYLQKIAPDTSKEAVNIVEKEI